MRDPFATISYPTVQRRLRKMAGHIRNQWSGVQRFERTSDASVDQVVKLTNGPNLLRLVAAISPIQDASYRALLRKFKEGSDDAFYRKSVGLFRMFGALSSDIPSNFLIKFNRKFRFVPRWLHETTLVVAGAGMSSPELDLVWKYYPQHGIPIGLRSNGTLLLFVGEKSSMLVDGPSQPFSPGGSDVARHQ